jgi:hypothetical protein
MLYFTTLNTVLYISVYSVVKKGERGNLGG